MKLSTSFKLLLIAMILCFSEISEAQWQSTGLNGGNVTHSTSSNGAMYLVTNNKVLHRSTDNGSNWAPIYMSNDESEFGQIYSIDAHENAVWLAHYFSIAGSTDNGNTWPHSYSVGGCPCDVIAYLDGFWMLIDECAQVHRSSDNGMNWAIISHIDASNFPSAFNGLASKNSKVFLTNRNGEMLMSSNHGTNWSLLLDSGNVLSFTSVFSTDSALFVCVSGKGLLRSGDDGNSWSYSNQGLSLTNVNYVMQYGNSVYCSGFGKVFRSEDNGITWTEFSNGLPLSNITSMMIGSGEIFATLYGAGLYSSANNGETWSDQNQGFEGREVNSFVEAVDQHIACTNDSRLFRTNEEEFDWSESVNGLTGASKNRVCVNNSVLFCAASDNVYRSNDLGNSWNAIGPVSANYIDMAVSGSFVFVITYNKLYRTSNNGSSWELSQSGIPSSYQFAHISSTGAEVFVTGSYSVYRSTNSGVNWNAITPPDPYAFYINQFARCGDALYASSESLGLLKSINDGNNWTRIDLGYGSGASYSVLSHQCKLFVGHENGISYSYDNGRTWQLMNEGLPPMKKTTFVGFMVNSIYSSMATGGFYLRPLSQFPSPSDDVGVQYISSPKHDSLYLVNCQAGAVVIPEAMIANFVSSNQFEPFSIHCEISYENTVVYSDSTQDTIGANSFHKVTFAPFNVEPYTFTDDSSKTYKVRVWTSLANDEVRQNDTSSSALKTSNPPGYGFSQNSNYYFLNSSNELSCAPEQPQYSFMDTTGSVTLISNGVPAVPFTQYNSFYFCGSYRLPDVLPAGKRFKFFGVCYDTVFISTTGVIGFGSVSLSRMNTPTPISIPSISAPYPAIFPFWYWINFSDPEPSGRNLKYKISGNNFILTFDRVPLYNTVIDQNDYVSFQVVLGLSNDCGGENGKITVLYNLEASGSTFINHYLNNNLNAMTVGIQNQTGMTGLTYRRSETNHSLTVPGPLFDNLSTDNPGSLAVEFGQINEVLPVELISFTSEVEKNDVTLKWSVSNEIDNAGFDIERRTVTDNSNAGWQKAGYVAGKGNYNGLTDYTFEDKGLPSGRFSYRLKQIDFNGNYINYELGGTVSIGVPDRFRLEQNYPNPFNPKTTIDYEVPYNSSVTIKLFDLSGREIRSVVNELKSAGYYSVTLESSELASGVYMYVMNAGNFVDSRKMIVIK
ncbi:MAG: T9SS type A sorting domain-containing protein [Ignavibacteria bacterium]|nr:T9SS type A sorting domain-containing protein [Ignavibacteria bacterium]